MNRIILAGGYRLRSHSLAIELGNIILK